MTEKTVCSKEHQAALLTEALKLFLENEDPNTTYERRQEILKRTLDIHDEVDGYSNIPARNIPDRAFFGL